MGSKRYSRVNPEYDRYIHSTAWRKIADVRMEMDQHTCCVCGNPAEEVHHLTYDNFKNEKMDDLVSLCRKCHRKAEDIADPAVVPSAINTKNNFMAFMRSDAYSVAPIVFEYLMKVRGSDFDSLMIIRQPVKGTNKRYWSVLTKAVNALCRKRYALTCVEDRRSMMVEALCNHVEVICLSQIEHAIRNKIQNSLHEIVQTDYLLFEKWKDVSTELGVSTGTLQTLRGDDGTSYGPSLRETVLYYCGLDAAAGLYPVEGFECLSEQDYEELKKTANYMMSVSGDGAFKGEYVREEEKDA